MGTHLYDSFHSLERILEGNQELRKEVQVNLITTLSLGSMKTDRVISEPCYNEVIYNRHIAK